MRVYCLLILIFLLLGKTYCQENYATTPNSNEFKIAFDSYNTPYVFFVDKTNTAKGQVRKYENGKWKDLGPSKGITAGSLFYACINIVIDKTNTPIISYLEDGFNLNLNITLKKFTKNEWQTLGFLCIDHNSTFRPDIGLDSLDNIYIPYNYYTSPNSIPAVDIVKYANKEFQYLGHPTARLFRVGLTKISISKNNIISLLAQGTMPNYPKEILKLYRYNENKKYQYVPVDYWEELAVLEYSRPQAVYSYNIDNDGNSYALLVDNNPTTNKVNKVTLKKAVENRWIDFEPAIPTINTATFSRSFLFIDKIGTLYLEVVNNKIDGSFSTTIYRFDGKNWTEFSIFNDLVNEILFDSKNNIIITTTKIDYLKNQRFPIFFAFENDNWVEIWK